MSVIWARLRIIVIPLILILVLFLLQVQTELRQLQTLPSPGWSRTMKASPALETTSVPLVQLDDKEQLVHFYLTNDNGVNQVAMTPSLQVTKTTPYNLNGPVHSLFWGNGNQFIYQKGKGLYFYSNSKSVIVSPSFDQAAALSNVLIYSKGSQLIEFIPETRSSSEIAAFASPVYAIHSTGSDRTLLVTTQNSTTRQLTFFLLKDQAEKGFAVYKLGFITPAKNQQLVSSQITKTKTAYFMVLAFASKNGTMQLENVSLPLSMVAQGQVGRPKAKAFTIKNGPNGKPLTSFKDLNLCSKGGAPVLLFVGTKRDHLENQVMVAEPNKEGQWTAEKRSAPLHPKSTPFWASANHQLIGWLSPEKGSLKTIEFTSHHPALISKSLQLTKRDLIHASRLTLSKMDRLGRFMLISLLAGVPALLMLFILRRWAKGLLISRHINTCALGVFLAAEGELVHHFIFSIKGLPTYLNFPFNTFAYITGLALISFFLAKWMSPKLWSLRSKVGYGVTLFLLLLTFLAGPYFY
ncbi:MAG TPA: hypothetical protein VFH42_00380 [Sporolactobacillaceae bacterium]|nr:hypothetical protein [Sporolactobacillaceae bacterium]